MKEIPILFSGPMVRAILDGRKTQTRRVIKGPPWCGVCMANDRCIGDCDHIQPAGMMGLSSDGQAHFVCGDCAPALVDPTVDYSSCPYGQPGDRLWVRETWCVSETYDAVAPRDLADGTNVTWKEYVPMQPWLPIELGRWRPSIYMPKWACRLWLEVKAVRVERLQDISEDDCWNAEGVGHESELGPLAINGRRVFASFWDSLNAKRGHSWDTNPWVWVVEFERLDDKAVRKG